MAKFESAQVGPDRLLRAVSWKYKGRWVTGAWLPAGASEAWTKKVLDGIRADLLPECAATLVIEPAPTPEASPDVRL